MATSDVTRAFSRISFAAALVVSWLGVTALVTIMAWKGERTIDTLSGWAGLWFFAVAAPTVQAVIVHKRLNDLVVACPSVPERIRRDLAHTRSTMLMFSTMIILIAFSLGLGR